MNSNGSGKRKSLEKLEGSKRLEGPERLLSRECFDKLTPELWVVVLKQCDRSAFLKLRATSYFFYDLGTPILYQDVDISWHESDVVDRACTHQCSHLYPRMIVSPCVKGGNVHARQKAFLESINHREENALLVRRFKFTIVSMPPHWRVNKSYEDLHTTYYALLYHLKRATHVDLNICHHSPDHYGFPRLILFPVATEIRVAGAWPRDLSEAIFSWQRPQLRKLIVNSLYESVDGGDCFVRPMQNFLCPQLTGDFRLDSLAISSLDLEIFDTTWSIEWAYASEIARFIRALHVRRLTLGRHGLPGDFSICRPNTFFERAAAAITKMSRIPQEVHVRGVRPVDLSCFKCLDALFPSIKTSCHRSCHSEGTHPLKSIEELLAGLPEPPKPGKPRSLIFRRPWEASEVEMHKTIGYITCLDD